MASETHDPETFAHSVKLATLTVGLSACSIIGDLDALITGIQYDSRKIRRGDLFVALVGGYFDGHEFVTGAINQGAAALLVERQIETGLPQLIVPNTRAALAIVASTFYGHPSLELDVIGVTGTDGKTTTSYLIESIFEAAGRKTGIIGTVGVRIGSQILDVDTRQTTPESLDVQRHLRTMVDNGVETAIVEATSHGLDLNRLNGTRFVTGAVTNVTLEHLEHHKTVAAYRRAKGILFERVGKARGTAVINLDDPGAREMERYATGSRVITYSASGNDAYIRAVDVQLSVDGTRFAVETSGERLPFEMPLVGEFNVANSLCAVGVALSHDISLQICQHSLTQTVPVPGRMQSIRRGQPFAVIVDYAHTPESVEKVLTLLRRLTAGRLILVMGSAGERDPIKRPLQGRVAAERADFSIFTTEDPRFEDPDAIIDAIAAGAIEAGSVQGKHFDCITDRTEAIRRALAVAEPGDCVLLAGKGHERSIIWGMEKRPWDEAAVANQCLRELGYDEDHV